jgi:alpha-tubulin suppressor-like RCC1 family protein
MNGVYKVSVGYSHGLMVKNGNLYSWGYNSSGQLGLGDPGITYVHNPKLVSSSGNWTAVSAGYDHSLGICGGYLYSWGNNYSGQLGLTYCHDYWAAFTDAGGNPLSLENYGHSSVGKLKPIEYSPQKVGGLNGWTKVAAGDKISFGIRSGYLYGWGNNSNSDTLSPRGILGLDFDNWYPSLDMAALVFIVPVRVSPLTGWTDISTSSVLSTFVVGVAGGKLQSWGSTNRGQLGNGQYWPTGRVAHTSRLILPTPFSYFNNESALFGGLTLNNTQASLLPSNTTWQAVSAGRFHAIGVSGGNLYGWGYNLNGAIGDGTTFDSLVPKLVDSSTDYQWVKVSAGDQFSVGLKEPGGIGYYEPYSWGANFNAQLGDGTMNRSLIPKGIGTDTYADIDAGELSCAGIESATETYKLYTWGFDPFKQLSSQILANPNDKIPQTYKTKNPNVKKISAGWDDIYILDKYGNLDHITLNGTTNVSPDVLEEFNYSLYAGMKIWMPIKDIAAGFNTAIVSKADNTFSIDARGYNSILPYAAPYYSITDELQNMPSRAWQKIVRNGDEDKISKVFCGGTNYGIVFSDGTIETWGKFKTLETAKQINIKWQQVVSGGDHLVILTKHGDVYCIGDNTHGQCNVPFGLSGASSVFATQTASGAVLQNGDVVYWGNTESFDGVDQFTLFDDLQSPDNLATTARLPLNRRYEHNLIGYTFDGAWGEDLYKQEIKNKLQNYYNQTGQYPDKLILNIEEGINNPLRWFNEPASIKYLGFTLNSAGVSSANDGVTYQNVWATNHSVAPTRYEDFSKVLQTITNFYSLGYTLAKQAIYELSGSKNTTAVGFNTGQLLPDYTLVGFSAYGTGYTLNSVLSWSTGNTLVNYREYSNDDNWKPYIIQGPDSYLPISGFDVSSAVYKPYSGTTATSNYYIRSTGITSAVYTAYYNRWKEFLNSVDFDFVIDTNISKFILPTEISNTPLLWTKTKQLLSDYETNYSTKLNKNLLSSFSHNIDSNIGTTLDVVNYGPVLSSGATGIHINIQTFINSISNSVSNNYNGVINNFNVFDTSVLAILGDTVKQTILDQWYYYGINGGTFPWPDISNDSGLTYINWRDLQFELSNETYSVFSSGKPNTTKLIDLINYFNELNTASKEGYNFYTLNNIIKTKSGKDHSVLLDKYGKVYFLGSTLDNRQNLPDKVYIDVSAGDLHSAGIDTTGTLYTAGKIIIDSGGCSGTTLTTTLTPISGTFDTVESGSNHLGLFEIGDNKKYIGRIDKIDDVFKRIYVKGYSAPDETNISFDDPTGTIVSIFRDGALIKTIQHKLLSIDSYINTVQNIIIGDGNVQDVSANNGAIWKTYFINDYKNTENNDYLITPYKIQQQTLIAPDIKYLNSNKLYQLETVFREGVKTDNKINIVINEL